MTQTSTQTSVPDVQISYQVTVSDYLDNQKADMIEWWGKWRDAQLDIDLNKALVDECFGEYIRTLDHLRASFHNYTK